MRIRKAMIAAVMGFALVGTAACGPQIVECDEDGVICTDRQGGGNYDEDREYGDDDEWEDD